MTIWIGWRASASSSVDGVNIAGIAQILHLEHRNSELESDNSDLQTENARLRSKEPTAKRRSGNR